MGRVYPSLDCNLIFNKMNFPSSLPVLISLPDKYCRDCLLKSDALVEYAREYLKEASDSVKNRREFVQLYSILQKL
jgi:hypothetical protein